jgi:hypothetical protein
MTSHHALTKPLVALAALLVSACGQDPSGAKLADTAATPGQKMDVADPASPPSAPSFPKELSAWEAAKRKECVDYSGGRFDGVNRDFLTADFNSDGQPDYILSELNVACDDGTPAYARYGKAGPGNEFLISGASGYRLIEGFSGTIGESNIKRRPAGDVIQFEGADMSAGACDGTFIITWSWTGTKMDLTDRRNTKGQKVDSMGCPVSASGSLPIKLGYYGFADDGCAVALRSYTGGITISDKYWGDIDGDYPIRPVRDLGGGRYRLGEAVDMIRVTGPDSFVADEGTEYERRFLWCSAKAPK